MKRILLRHNTVTNPAVYRFDIHPSAHLGRPVGSSHGDACSDWADGAAHDRGAALTSVSRRDTGQPLFLRAKQLGHTRLPRKSLLDVIGHAYCELLQRPSYTGKVELADVDHWISWAIPIAEDEHWVFWSRSAPMSCCSTARGLRCLVFYYVLDARQPYGKGK